MFVSRKYVLLMILILLIRMSQIHIKNGFAIFSGAVAVGSKGGLMVPGAVWAVAASMWDVTSSM